MSGSISGARAQRRCGRRRGVRFGVRCGLLGLPLAFAFAVGVGARAAEFCAPRPGQPAPLPRIDDADAFRARWASLRARELSESARAIETADPFAAHAFWVRAACLDPGSTSVSQGVARTAAAQVHRPRVVVGSAPLPPRGDGWAELDEPVVVVRAPGPFVDLARRAEARAALLADIDALMDETRDRLRAARFEEALEAAARTRVALDEMREDDDLPPRWARLEVLQATAELALGRLGAAEASMGRALAADPSLELDPTTTSPKVMRVFESSRDVARGGR
jgi:hypothetical protein